MNNITQEYKDWLNELKSKVRSAQLKTSVAINSAMISFYWELGKMVSEKAGLSNWGDKILNSLSRYSYPFLSGIWLQHKFLLMTEEKI